MEKVFRLPVSFPVAGLGSLGHAALLFGALLLHGILASLLPAAAIHLLAFLLAGLALLALLLLAGLALPTLLGLLALLMLLAGIAALAAFLRFLCHSHGPSWLGGFGAGLPRRPNARTATMFLPGAEVVPPGRGGCAGRGIGQDD